MASRTMKDESRERRFIGWSFVSRRHQLKTTRGKRASWIGYPCGGGVMWENTRTGEWWMEEYQKGDADEVHSEISRDATDGR